MKRLNGFTLAEVLITLGIIGVVAAMTLPTLIAHYQKIVLETQYKKGVSVLANAMQLMMAKNETPGNMLQTQLFECYGYDSNTQKSDCLKEYSKTLFNIIADSSSGDFQSKLENIKYGFPKDSIYGMLGMIFPPVYAGDINLAYIWNDVSYSFTVTDGITYGYTNIRNVDDDLNTTGIEIVMDVNGTKNPNIWGEDLYILGINKKGQAIDMSCIYTININNPAEMNECYTKLNQYDNDL